MVIFHEVTATVAGLLSRPRGLYGFREAKERLEAFLSSSSG